MTTYFTSVLDFGAVGDGVTDDLAAFVAAMESFGPPGAGGVLLVPAGTYCLSDTLHISRRMVLRGISGGIAAATTLKFTTPGPGIAIDSFQTSPDGGDSAGGARIENLKIQGSLPPRWAPGTTYEVGDFVRNIESVASFTNHIYKCVQAAGAPSGEHEPLWPRRGDVSTILTSAVSALDTTITVLATKNLPTSGTLVIGEEEMTFAGNEPAEVGTVLNVSRPAPTSHAVNDNVREVRQELSQYNLAAGYRDEGHSRLGYYTENTYFTDRDGNTWQVLSAPGIWIRRGAVIDGVYVEAFPGDAIYACGYVLPPVTKLSAAVDDTQLEIPVYSTAHMPTSGLLLVGSETIQYTSVHSDAFIVPPGGRGFNGTTAAVHAGETVVGPSRFSAATSSSVKDSIAQFNLGRAFYAEGTDATGMVVRNLVGQVNNSGGIFDQADVGNVFVACLMQQNGIYPYAAGAPSTTWTGPQIPARPATRAGQSPPNSPQTNNHYFYMPVSSRLASALGSADTIVELRDTSGFPAMGSVVIDTETLAYGEIVGNELRDLTRSAPASHPVHTLVFNYGTTSSEPDWPTTIGDTVLDGTVVWRNEGPYNQGQPFMNRNSGITTSQFLGCYSEPDQVPSQVYWPANHFGGSGAGFSSDSSGLILANGQNTTGLRYQSFLDGGVVQATLGGFDSRPIALSWNSYNPVTNSVGSMFAMERDSSGDYWNLSYAAGPNFLQLTEATAVEGMGQVLLPNGVYIGGRIFEERPFKLAVAKADQGVVPEPAAGTIGDVVFNRSPAGSVAGWQAMTTAPSTVWQPFRTDSARATTVAVLTTSPASPRLLTLLEHGSVFVPGAFAQVYVTLPSVTSPQGVKYEMWNRDVTPGAGFRINAGTGQVIHANGIETSIGGWIESTTFGDSVALESLGTGLWLAHIWGSGWTTDGGTVLGPLTKPLLESTASSATLVIKSNSASTSADGIELVMAPDFAGSGNGFSIKTNGTYMLRVLPQSGTGLLLQPWDCSSALDLATLIFQTSQIVFTGRAGTPVNLADGAGTSTIGTPSTLWQSATIKQYATSIATQSVNGSVTVDPTAGEMQVIAATGSISSITLGAGLDGELLTLSLLQNGAGTATWPTTFTNAKIAGGSFSKTLTSSAIDTITLRWDGTSWLEVGRAAALA